MSGNTRKVLVPLATMAVAAAVTVGSGATWTSSSDISSEVSAGSVLIDNSKDGVALSISKLHPGDEVSGTVVIKNTGDLDGDLTLTESNVSQSTFQNGMLTLKIETIPVGGSTATNVFGPGAVGAVGSNVALGPLAANDDAAGGPDEVQVKFTVKLSEQADDTNQGATVSADYTFTNTEQDGQSPVGW